MIRIRKLILGLDEDMLYNRVWRFIPVEYIFDDPQNPWTKGFPETISYEFGAEDNRYAGSFIALKVGDVNGSAMTQVEERSSAKSSLLLNDQQLIAGKSYEISVAMDDASGLEGLQFSLGWDTRKVSLENMEGVEMQEEEIAFLAQHQLVTGSWINTRGDHSEEPTLFRLKIRAKQNAMLHEVIHLSNRITKSEAYTNTGQVQSLALKFKPEANLSWNINSNPFYNETQLNFSEPINGTIQIFDKYGRLRLQQKIEANSNFRLYKSDLGGAGTYFFSVTTANQKVNGKFIAL